MQYVLMIEKGYEQSIQKYLSKNKAPRIVIAMRKVISLKQQCSGNCCNNASLGEGVVSRYFYLSMI